MNVGAGMTISAIIKLSHYRYGLKQIASLHSAHFHGTDVPVEEPSTASKADIHATNRSSRLVAIVFHAAATKSLKAMLLTVRRKAGRRIGDWKCVVTLSVASEDQAVSFYAIY
jgi:hypothetical protein